MAGSASLAQAASEHELISASRHGDDRAFEELYARYSERIFGFILGRVRDHGRAEDIGQEVFISALRRLRSTDQPIHFKPWIYEIAKNACIDEHRRDQRHPEVSLDAEDGLEAGVAALRSIAPSPPAAVESKQKLDDLRGAFGGLSRSHHQLLVMREFEGLSYDEIGTRTGMSRQMVESALFRARRKLGVEYEELASGRRCQQVQDAIATGKLSSRRALGVRERRQVARHLAHCQPCRVSAHLAGVDDAMVRSGLGAKIAALLPFPIWRLWPFGRAARAAARAGSDPGMHSTLESGSGALLGGAVVAVAALAIGGSGSSAATNATHHRAAAPIHGVSSAPAAPAAIGISSRAHVARPSGTRGTAALGLHRSAPVRTRHAAARPRVSRAAAPHGTATRGGVATGSAAGRSVSVRAPAALGPAGRTVSEATRSTLSTVSRDARATTNTIGRVIAGNPVVKQAANVLSSLPGTVTGTPAKLPVAANPAGTGSALAGALSGRAQSAGARGLGAVTRTAGSGAGLPGSRSAAGLPGPATAAPGTARRLAGALGGLSTP